VLYQCTHAEVTCSRSARVRIGPVRNGEPWRTHSVLYSPIVVSASALSRASPDRADRRDQPGQSEVLENSEQWEIKQPAGTMVTRILRETYDDGT
jgi:hypothetical protein